jgi:hypothetical protein
MLEAEGRVAIGLGVQVRAALLSFKLPVRVTARYNSLNSGWVLRLLSVEGYGFMGRSMSGLLS